MTECPCDYEFPQYTVADYAQNRDLQPRREKTDMCAKCGFYWGVK